MQRGVINFTAEDLVHLRDILPQIDADLPLTHKLNAVISKEKQGVFLSLDEVEILLDLIGVQTDYTSLRTRLLQFAQALGGVLSS